MGWGDRIIGLVFGFILGLLLVIPTYIIFSFVLPLSRNALVGIGQGIMIGSVIWGWIAGSYQLGRLIGWVKQRFR